MQTTAAERIHLRASFEAKQTIEQAAALSGVSVSAFVLEHAYQAARKAILEQQQIRLCREDWAALEQALDNPPPPLKQCVI
ncbi:DUF1778 domain-containing protein [Agitococcus lubricus]|uniref:Uncharacterized protein (DUF1778 family) n=1 Tax=Agitococcus lubricus TaxID=1077255 RepID=A0A2T5IT79_9GAMM|nr:DUF1778 domain-containing protein [Agitococcus lubricus]PTQ87059.1 uncharacterized protein (DUF1778 family) [Agitococcus lubricus]